MRPKIKPNDEKYWEYVLGYVDDILVMSHQPKVVMDYLTLKYTLKEGSRKELEAYLGAEICQWTIDGSDDLTKVHCAMSSNLYVKRVVTEVERELSEIRHATCHNSVNTYESRIQGRARGDPRVGC